MSIEVRDPFPINVATSAGSVAGSANILTSTQGPVGPGNATDADVSNLVRNGANTGPAVDTRADSRIQNYSGTGGAVVLATKTQTLTNKDLSSSTNTNPGRELGYASTNTSWTSPTPGSLTDVPGLSITVTVGSRPIFLQCQLPLGHTSAASGYLFAYLVEGTTTVQRGFTDKSDTRYNTLSCGVRLAPSAGTHTYKVQIFTDNAVAGIQVLGDANTISWIRATEA